MTPLSSPVPCKPGKKYIHVLLDGRVLGVVSEDEAGVFAEKLRTLKVLGKDNVPPTLEIGLVPVTKAGQYPGLFLFTTPARMMRPVTNLRTKTEELIGSFEQVYLNVAVCSNEITKQVYNIHLVFISTSLHG